MNDFFSKRPADAADEENQQEEVREEAPERIKVGEAEYDPQELDKLVKLGKLGEEMQSKYNTDFTKVWPEYTRSRQELKEAQRYKEELENFKKQAEAKPAGGELDPAAVAQAKEAARKLNLLLEEDMPNKLEPVFKNWYQRERAAERLLDQCKDYESKLTGKDGRPAFNTEEVLQYMADTGIKDPELAYKAKYEREIDEWKANQLGNSRRSGMSTITEGATTKQPKQVKITNQNVDSLMEQALRGEI